MNKKSLSWLNDIAAILISILLIIFWMIVMQWDSAGRTNVISEQEAQIDNNDAFVSMLRTEIDGEYLSDMIINAYLSNENALLESKMGNYLKQIYESDVCWQLSVGDDELINIECETDSKKELLRAQTLLPIKQDNVFRSANVELIITGYKK